MSAGRGGGSAGSQTALLAALLAAAVCGLPGRAYAQETPAGDTTSLPAPDTVRLPPLEAAVRRSLFDPGLARSVERLEPGREVLPFSGLADWLDSRAAVRVRGYGGGGRQVLSVRGGRPEGVLVLLDGLPLNDPVTGVADVSGISLHSLRSAVLIRGAGAARYGSGALGGVLLLRSKSADSTRPKIRLGLSSYGGYEASGAAAWSVAGADLRLGAGLRGAENDYTYRNRLVPGAPRSTRENADSQVRWVTLGGRAGRVRGTLRFDGLERGVPGRLGTTTFAGDRWRESRWSATGAATWGDAGLHAGLRRLSMDYEPGDGGAASRQHAFDVRAGGEIVVHEMLDVVVAGRASLERLSGDGLGEAPERLSAGVTLRRSFGVDGEAGATGEAGTGFGTEPLLGFDVSGDDRALSPELGLWFRPGPSTRIYGRIGRAFRVPTFADLHFEAAPGVAANPALEAERVVLDAELGLEASRPVGAATGSVRVAAWVRETRRPIVWIASSVSVWSPRNLDRLTARGLDLQARLVAGPEAEIGWAAETAVSLQRSRVGFGSNRNPLPYQPDLTARASVEVHGGPTAARLDARWTGSRTTSLAATRRLDGFVTIDATLRRRFAPGPFILEATLGIENLLDERYELVELFPEPGRRFTLTFDIH